MRISVRYFAMLRERRGAPSEVVVVAPGATVGSLYADLFPEPRPRVGFVVRGEVAPADAPLADGDEVLFLPPVGGG